MREHHYTSCVGPVRLVERLGLPWMLRGTGSPHFRRAVTGDGGTGFELGLSPAQLGSVPKLLQQKPRGLSASWLCSLDVCVFFCPHAGTLALESGDAEAEGGSCRLSARASHRESSRLSPVRRLLKYSRSLLSFCADVALRASSLRHVQWVTDPGYCRPWPPVDPHPGRAGPTWTFCLFWGEKQQLPGLQAASKFCLSAHDRHPAPPGPRLRWGHLSLSADLHMLAYKIFFSLCQQNETNVSILLWRSKLPF